MASAEQINMLRLMINEPVNAEPWTDDTLSGMIDASESMDMVAADIWEAKAAGVAHLVDISEGGSQRKMGDVYEQFLSMSKTYRTKTAVGVAASGRMSISRPAERA